MLLFGRCSLGALMTLALAAPAAAQTVPVTDPAAQRPVLNQRDYRMQAVNPVPYALNNPEAAAPTPGGAYAKPSSGQAGQKPVYGYPVQNRSVVAGNRAQPAPAPLAPPPPSDADDDLRHTTGLDLGAQFGNYHYQEQHITQIGGNDISIREDGLKYGLTAAFTGSLYGDWFAKLDTRFAMGNLEYEGWLSNGTPLVITDIPNYYVEARAMVGHDWVFGDFAVAPMGGVGFRYLFDNPHDSSQAYGYGRGSQYVFLPAGFESRLRLRNQDVVSASVEFDYFLFGNQKSYLGDLPFPAPGYRYKDITNDQHTGYGLRAEMLYHHKRWSFGPYLNYWNINQSDWDEDHTGYEPHNQTMDFGIQFKYRFWKPGDNFWPGQSSVTLY